MVLIGMFRLPLLLLLLFLLLFLFCFFNVVFVLLLLFWLLFCWWWCGGGLIQLHFAPTLFSRKMTCVLNSQSGGISPLCGIANKSTSLHSRQHYHWVLFTHLRPYIHDNIVTGFYLHIHVDTFTTTLSLGFIYTSTSTHSRQHCH